MRESPTLLDAVVRESFRPGGNISPDLRPVLTEARRFVLDHGMSSFLSELSHEPFANLKTKSNKANVILEQLRRSARLPHAQTWIEYDSRAYKAATLKDYGNTSYVGVSPASIEETCHKIGWMITPHPQIDTAFIAMVFAGFDPICVLPVAYSWCSEDQPLPFQRMNMKEEAGFMTGISGYDSKFIGITPTPDIHKIKTGQRLIDLLMEFTGEFRRIISLLSTINDLPLRYTPVISSKGYVARGRYRRYLDHTTITLMVPGRKTTKRIAAEALAIARRRAHQVRGHWRRDYRHPGERLWVHEHQRGDASLGFVLHDYQVRHGEE